MSRINPDPAGCLKPSLAREHAQAAAQRMRQHDKTVTAYRCRACGAWHVGGAASNKRRALPTFNYYMEMDMIDIEDSAAEAAAMRQIEGDQQEAGYVPAPCLPVDPDALPF